MDTGIVAVNRDVKLDLIHFNDIKTTGKAHPCFWIMYIKVIHLNVNEGIHMAVLCSFYVICI